MVKSFRILRGNQEIGSYSLPIYNAQRPVAEKIALTPVTMTADAVIAAALAGLIFVCLSASSN
jgi:hypothetical protein